MQENNRKKILIVFPGVLFPVSGMSQVRAIQQIKSLGRSFIVDLFFIAKSHKDAEVHRKELEGFCRNIHYTLHPKYSYGKLYKMLFAVKNRLFLSLFGMPADFQYYSDKKVRSAITDTAINNNYHLILAHYWHVCSFMKDIPTGILKAIDTHYVVEENIEIFEKGLYEKGSAKRTRKELFFSRKKQHEFFRVADILIFNSSRQFDILKDKLAGKILNVTPNGQELEPFLSYPSGEPEKILLFYGAMGNQFNLKAIKVLVNEIIPKLKEKIKDLKVMFVGNKPPDWLKKMDNGGDFIVTGFVEDIRPYLSRSFLCLMPLTTASGFRGRTIELMSMGVPVIGTHNALDSVGFKDGEEGFITDDTDRMVEIAVNLFNDPSERRRISENAKRFVRENYTLEATFGKLSAFLEETIKT